MSAKGIDAKAVKDQLRGTKLPKGEVKALNALIDNAAKTMAALDKFTGRAIGMSTVRGVDGYQTWNTQTPEGQAIQSAIDAQAALSEKMRSLINAEGVSRKAKAVLEATAMTCDRRACELETLVLQFAEALTNIRSKADLKNLDPAILARLDTKIFALMGEKAATMHGQAEALDHMRQQLAPLAQRLDGFASNPDTSIGSAAFAAMRQEFSEAKSALETLATAGYKAGEGRVHPDKAFMDAAKAILEQVENRMTGARQRLGRAALESYIDSVFGPPKSLPLLAPKFRPLLNIRYPQATRLVQAKEAVHQAARTYAKEPTPANLAALKTAINDYSHNPDAAGAGDIAEDLVHAANGFLVTDENVLAAKIEKKKAKLPANVRGTITPELVAEFKAALEKYTKGELPPQVFADCHSRHHTYVTQLAHFEDMVKSVNRMADEDFLTSKTFLGAFEGEIAPSILVEARVHGMRDDDVDPATDPSNVAKTAPLGQGAMNTVTAVVLKNGQARVFKPEAPGRASLERAIYVFEGYEKNQQLAQLNMATQRTADALGLGDVVAKTSVGKLDGQYGIFMSFAPGVSFEKFSQGRKAKGSLGAGDIQSLPTAKHAEVQGRLMRKCNRLDWLDVITGQGDRHHGNAHVDVRKDGQVDVTGIDNDTCYPAFRIGLDKYIVGGGHLQLFEDTIENAFRLYGESNVRKARERLLSDPGVTKNADGTYTLDASKFQAPELNYCLMYTFGIYSNHVPTVIDQDLYDRLQTLRAGPARDAYLADLKTRLSPAAFDAAVKRLDAAIARADVLKTKGRVYTEEDWNDRDKQKALYNDPGEKMPRVGPQFNTKPRNIACVNDILKGLWELTQGTYRRSQLDKSAKIGWFD